MGPGVYSKYSTLKFGVVGRTWVLVPCRWCYARPPLFLNNFQTQKKGTFHMYVENVMIIVRILSDANNCNGKEAWLWHVRSCEYGTSGVNIVYQYVDVQKHPTVPTRGG